MPAEELEARVTTELVNRCRMDLCELLAKGDVGHPTDTFLALMDGLEKRTRWPGVLAISSKVEVEVDKDIGNGRLMVVVFMYVALLDEE